MDGHVFRAGAYLPEEGKLSDFEQWKPFTEWFKCYMGHEPSDGVPGDVELFEAFYAGRIYQTELIHKQPTPERHRKIA